MKLTSPLYSLKAWGQNMEYLVSKVYRVEGSTVFRRQSSYTVLEKSYGHAGPRTAFQQEGRSMFRYAVASWQSLSSEEKASWAYYQDYRKRYPVMSGYNLFISKFLLSGGNPKIPPSGRK